MTVEKGFTFVGGCSGSMCCGSTPSVAYHFDDEVSSTRPTNIFKGKYAMIGETENAVSWSPSLTRNLTS